ncbi:MAG: GNAT family N-acetyltransferase [Pseudomonadota bacterium]
MISIRQATARDRQASRALHEASWRSAYRPFVPPVALEAPLEANMAARWGTWPEERLVLAAFEGDALLGFSAVVWERPALLDNLHVAPPRKGQGIGARLLSATAAHVSAAGGTALRLEVIAANAPSRGFYRKMGGHEGRIYGETLLGHPIMVAPFLWEDAALSRLAQQFDQDAGKGA